MKPRFLGVLVMAAAVQCTADNDFTLVINGAFPPAESGMGGGCGAASNPIASGLLDVNLAKGFGIGYLLFPSVLNKQIPNASYNRGIETNQIIIDTARVDVTFVPSSFFPDNASDPARHFDQTVYAYVPPESSATIPVDVIPAALVRQLPALDPNSAVYAQVKVQFIGQSNNSTIKSNTMTFTVNLCDRCLVRNVGACCAAATHFGLCSPAQDASIDCCTDPTGALLCPAAVVAGAACSDAGAP